MVFRQMRILTIRQAAEILAVKPQTLYQWAEMRKIPSLKLNGCVRFVEADILAWVKTCKKGASFVNSEDAETVACRPGKEDR